MNREYEVKHEDLIPYFEEAIKLVNKFERFHIGHIPRHENMYIDTLASLAMTLAILPGSSKQIFIGGRKLLYP